jgi:hypothetical protein
MATKKNSARETPDLSPIRLLGDSGARLDARSTQEKNYEK